MLILIEIFRQNLYESDLMNGGQCNIGICFNINIYIYIRISKRPYAFTSNQHKCGPVFIGTEDETLSTIYVAERMTWQDGYDYCKSKRKRLKYISPSTKAAFRDQNPHIAR